MPPRVKDKPPEVVKPAWSIDAARSLYNVDGWGAGYFDINDAGHVTVLPDHSNPERTVDLFELAMDLEAQGIALPVLLRFSDVLRSRIESLSARFAAAIEEFAYTGSYTTVYPIKVNQQRHVVEEVLQFGKTHGVGLECGSKPELHAVLALSEASDHIIVCNGYKDEEFMRLALMGQKLGHKVFIVLEQLSELEVLLQVAEDMGVEPVAGARIKLVSGGSGRWAQSGGERSKFGLSASQLMRAIDRLRDAGKLHILKLIHFHLGSQVTDIRYIKAGLQEMTRYYAELRALGVDITHVDVGGGLGVDYEGSSSTSTGSVNYGLQEYANDVVYTLMEACKEQDLPMPHIISESGRALTAHHALLLLKVIDVESQAEPPLPDIKPDDHPLLHEMADDHKALSRKTVTNRKIREIYHDATYAKERAQGLFQSGVLSLSGRAAAERIYFGILNGLARHVQRDRATFADVADELDGILVDRYFCNFSVFQSLPDSWAIDQLFPIMPVHRLDEEPLRRATLQDVTCDSDGKIDRFVGERASRPNLPLHAVNDGDDYILGIFLTGAYQEILGDLHNLFGDTNAVHIRLTDAGYEITDLVHGDTVTEVLNYVQFGAQTLLATFRRKVGNAKDLTRQEANAFIAEYVAGLEGYTYLEGGSREVTQGLWPALAQASPTEVAPLFAVFAAALLAAKLLGALAQRLGQPAVLGELLAGIVLGGSVLRIVDPGDPAVHVLAEIGVLVLLFEIGLQTEVRSLMRVGKSAITVACVGVVLPLVGGYAVARALGLGEIPALVAGAALTATSVGISARVLSDLGRLETPSGQIVLGAAVLDDIIGLIILSVVAGVVAGGTLAPGEVARIAGVGLGFVVIAVAAGRVAIPPLLRLVARLQSEGTVGVIALVFAMVVAWLAGLVGSAPIVGAFAAGLVLNPTPQRADIERRMSTLGQFFVPLFFVSVGAAVDLGAVANGQTLLIGGALTLVGIAGKVLAGFAPWWLPGEKLLIGVAMVPRGEVGLIFAQMGLASAAISPGVFGALMLMVLVTTFVTPPALGAIARRSGARSIGARPGDGGIDDLVMGTSPQEKR